MNILIKYECKKILCRKSTLIAGILMALSICVFSGIFVSEYSFSDKNGTLLNGLEAIHAKKVRNNILTGSYQQRSSQTLCTNIRQ